MENVNEINKVKINLIRFSLTIHKNNKKFSLNSVRSSSVHSTSIYIPCLSGCLFVCLYPINVKTAEPNGPSFLWGLTWPQRRFRDDQKLKKLPPSKLYFHKIWKSTKTSFILYTKRKCSPSSSLYILYTLLVCLFVCIQ